eukprot:1908612-Pleurochrysis_carterae.AAC.1
MGLCFPFALWRDDIIFQQDRFRSAQLLRHVICMLESQAKGLAAIEEELMRSSSREMASNQKMS